MQLTLEFSISSLTQLNFKTFQSNSSEFHIKRRRLGFLPSGTQLAISQQLCKEFPNCLSSQKQNDKKWHNCLSPMTPISLHKDYYSLQQKISAILTPNTPLCIVHTFPYFQKLYPVVYTFLRSINFTRFLCAEYTALIKCVLRQNFSILVRQTKCF